MHQKDQKLFIVNNVIIRKYMDSIGYRLQVSSYRLVNGLQVKKSINPETRELSKQTFQPS